MPQSQARIVLHVTFSTKHRIPFLKEKEIRERLHSYMAAVLKDIECEPILINSVEDHIHILCNLSRNGNFIEAMKTGPSKWIKKQGHQYENFYWQRGYGIFSVSQSNLRQTRDYIAGQEEHHRKISFQEEFRALCRKHGLDMDENYVWE